MTKKWDKNYLYIGLIGLLAIIVILDPNNLFASKTDWINQHSVFPDYFRKLFYETGNLIPNFASNLGAGQNIFYFSYYGLLNPIILISYLLPFVSMTDYLISINIILFINTGLLLYYWLKTHFKDKKACFISTILILLSSSLLFHFHRHFMFVNYLPFLIIGLIGIDQYFKYNKKVLFTTATFLMIMTSFYYSIIGIYIFILYGVYRYIKINNRITVKKFLIDGIKFILPILIAVLMASVLLVPTAYVILTGRSADTVHIPIRELLIPNSNFNAVLYDNYTLGLTGIAIIAIMYLLSLKKAETRFIAGSIIITIIFPIIIYLLNGGLYVRNKIFITFLPILAYFIAYFIKDLRKGRINFKRLSIFTAIALILSLFSKELNPLIYLDIIITLLCLYIYHKYKKEYLLIIPLFLIAIPNFIIANKDEVFVSKNMNEQVFSSEKEKLIGDTLKDEKEIVRFNNLDDSLYAINKIYQSDYYQTSLYSSTYNNDYNHFFREVINNPLPNRNKLTSPATNNIMFQTIMGVKYLLYSNEPSIGYKKINGNKVSVYQNDNVLPIGYATNNIIPVDKFDKLDYVSRNEALIGSAIVEKDDIPVDIFNTSSEKIKLNYNSVEKKNISIKKDGDKYKINADKGGKVIISLDKTFDDDILFIDFKVNNQQSCDIGDQKITINKMGNKQTCKEWAYQNSNDVFHYVLSQNKKWNQLTINFDKGYYEISNIHTSIINYDKILSKVNNIDRFITQKQDKNHDMIKGTINVKKDGYFVTSIPYDRGFDIKVDGKKIKYEKVNKAFIGFKINKGNHQIEINYSSPLLREGKLISLIGFILFMITISLEPKKKLSD